MDDQTIIEVIHKLNNKASVAIGRIEMLDLEKLDPELSSALNVIKRNLYDMSKIIKTFRSKISI